MSTYLVLALAALATPAPAATPDDLLEAVRRASVAGRLRPVDPVHAAQMLWMNVHGVASMLITFPAELWPEAPAADDLVEQVIENGIRGLLADPTRA